MTRRRKAPAKTLPQSSEEAVALAEFYLTTQSAIDQLKADADMAIAQIQAARDEQALPLEQALKQIFSDLRDWWAVAGPTMTDGKRKSMEIAGILIGERTTPPSLKHPGLKAGDIADQLLDLRLEELLRIAINLDKPAILKALKANDDTAFLLSWLGLVTEQKDEFFIARAAPAEADPQIVAIEEAADGIA